MKTTDWDINFPHFSPEEYLSPEGLMIFHKKNVCPFYPEILFAMEELRANLNKHREEGLVAAAKEITLVINYGENTLRGFCTPYEWYALRPKKPGQLFSFHLWCAVDFHSPEVSIDTLWTECKLSPFIGLIKHKTFIHADRRFGKEYISE